MSWTVGLPLFLVWNERFFFLKTWGCYDVPEKHGDFEKHVEHVESTFRWVWSSIRSTTMLKMWWHVTKKTLAFHTFCLCLWTLTKIPSLKCRSMKMGKLYGTLSCLTDLSTVIDSVRCCMELTPSVPIPFAWHPSIRSLRLQILQLLICKVSHLQAFNHPKSRNLDPPLGTRCWSCSYCAGFNVIKG